MLINHFEIKLAFILKKIIALFEDFKLKTYSLDLIC